LSRPSWPTWKYLLYRVDAELIRPVDKLATSESRINPGQQRIDLIPIKRQTFESLAKRFPHDEAMFDHGHDEFSVLVASIG